MTNALYSPRSLLTAAVACLAVLASGCSAISPADPSVSALPGQASAPGPQAEQPVTAMITVEVRRAGKKKPEIRKMPLVGTRHVQEALEEIGATKRFRRMNVLVMRPARGQRQRLEVKYDHGSGKVEPLYDYVLHPGDHLVITQDTTTAFDDMLQSITGSMGMPTGR